MPIGLDWMIILPAVKEFLLGGDPYLVGEGFAKVYFPFWTYILLIPFSTIPFWIGRGLLFAVSLIAFAYTAIRLGATRWQLILFLSSSAVIGCLNNGNIDWLVTMGLWMPPWLGLFFVLIKPQIGLPVAIFWMYITWKKKSWKGLLQTFAPVAAAYLLSFLAYGFWPLHLFGMESNPENMSAFPFALPIGILLTIISIRRQEMSLSTFSGPLLAPYTSQFSYSASLLALLQRPRLFILAWILLWIPVLLRVYL